MKNEALITLALISIVITQRYIYLRLLGNVPKSPKYVYVQITILFIENKEQNILSTNQC